MSASTSVHDVADRRSRTLLELARAAPCPPRRLLEQFGAHRRAPVARRVRQRQAGLLDLAAQRDAALGLGQPPSRASSRAAAQRRHPRLAVGAAPSAWYADHRSSRDSHARNRFRRAARPGRELRVAAARQARPVRLAETAARPPPPPTAGAQRRAARRAARGRRPAPRRQSRWSSILDTTAITASVSAVAEIRQRAVGFGHRCDRRHDEHHRGGRCSPPSSTVSTNGASASAAQFGDQRGDPGQPRARHQHHVAASTPVELSRARSP